MADSLNVGTPREWLRPHNPDDPESARGDHRGPTEALNIHNAHPGMTYYYCRRNPNDIMRYLNDGWMPIGADDDEKWGAELPDSVQAELSGLKAFQDVILMKTSNENYARIKRDKDEQAESARTGSERSYIDAGHERTLQLGGSAPTSDLYYQKLEHHTSKD